MKDRSHYRRLVKGRNTKRQDIFTLDKNKRGEGALYDNVRDACNKFLEEHNNRMKRGKMA